MRYTQHIVLLCESYVLRLGAAPAPFHIKAPQTWNDCDRIDHVGKNTYSSLLCARARPHTRTCLKNKKKVIVLDINEFAPRELGAELSRREVKGGRTEFLKRKKNLSKKNKRNLWKRVWGWRKYVNPNGIFMIILRFFLSLYIQLNQSPLQYRFFYLLEIFIPKEKNVSSTL